MYFVDQSSLKSRAEQLSKRKRELDEDKEENSPRVNFRKTCPDQFSRVDLVLNLKQLILGNCPCPIYNPFNNFKQIKSSYKPVSSSSRIFALDVETVRSFHALPINNILFQFSDLTNNRQIPYWIAVVDEQLNCVYQTLIKPNERQYLNSYEQR